MALKDLEMTPIDKFVNAPVATGALVSPWWLEPLHKTSEVAAELLPIFGLTWLFAQIIYKSGQVFGLWGKRA